MSIPEPSAIGIDLGTTNCCVAVFRNGRCEAVPSGNGSTTIPSYVAFEDDHCVVGQEAKDNAFGHPKGTIFAVKRILGHRYSEVEDGVRLSQRWPFALTADENGFAAVRLPDDCGMTKVIWKPEEVSGELLKHLKELAQDFLGCPVQRAVITVPASFTEHQRRCTLAAGIMAGLEVVGIVNEPTAAAIAYGLQTPAGENEKTRIILVCDFGGGTIDVSIISAVGRSTFQVLGTSGNMHLGGEDFDDCLVEELLLRWEELHGPGIRQSPAAMTRLRKQAQQVKHTLATGTEENAGVVLASLFGGVDFRTTVSRTTFEKVCGHLFQQALEPIETAMRLTNMRKQDLSHIVLVGGSSRMRVFRDMVADYFPDQRIFKDIHPDEAIAIGAGLMAQNAGELTVADVIALDLGTEVWGGGMTVILPRFSKVPSSAEKVFTTTVDFQTRISVMVYEGTDPVAKNNRFWGRLLMTGIQPALAGFPKIAVTYEYDHFGILKVSAKDLATDSTVETSINLNVPNGS